MDAAPSTNEAGTWVSDANVALLTDLYELTMAASYHGRATNHPATFDLFVREMSSKRNFLIMCGLEDALRYLENLHFDEDAIDYLRSLDLFDEDFLRFLAGFRFTGDVWAIAEGEAVFPREPLVRVTAPLIEAQMVETFLINCVSFQTMIASKAARVTIACGPRSFVDFSLRRDHGAEAGLKAARAAFIGGASGTSNVLAGREYGIPVSGTMAHSYVMSFAEEIDAFRTYARQFPDRAILLIDTFDVEEGARTAVRVGQELAPEGIKLSGVRIDSGDLASLARSVRKILDDGGLPDVQIILSGDLDEYRIRRFVAEDVPADVFGVGTQLGTSGDAPTLGTVYKLVADHSGPKVKLSTGKATLPGRKQVYRVTADDRHVRDVIALEEEVVEDARALLEPVMSEGKRARPAPSIFELQRRCADTLVAMPEACLALESRCEYPVDLSAGLQSLTDKMRSRT